MTERDLVLEARALKSELKQDRTSAFCKAVTHIAVTAKTENLISAMAYEIERLRDLIVHMHVHSGYRNNGYMQMTTPQKELYDAIWKRSVAELDAEDASYSEGRSS